MRGRFPQIAPGTVRQVQQTRWLFDPSLIPEGQVGIDALATILGMMGIGLMGPGHYEHARELGVAEYFVRHPDDATIIIPGMGEVGRPPPLPQGPEGMP